VTVFADATSAPDTRLAQCPSCKAVMWVTRHYIPLLCPRLHVCPACTDDHLRDVTYGVQEMVHDGSDPA
jgi:hypothetical protein